MIKVVFPNGYVATYSDDEVGKRMIKKGECKLVEDSKTKIETKVETKTDQVTEQVTDQVKEKIKPNLGKK